MTFKFNPNTLSLGWYSQEEITKISDVEITLPVSFDMFGHPVPDGLYDLRMGPLKMDQVCQTCNLGYLNCPGHFGHMKLSKTLLNPLCYETTYALMKSCCLNCFHFKITAAERLKYYAKLLISKKGIKIPNVDSFLANKTEEQIEKELNEIKPEPTGYEQSQHYDYVSQFVKKISVKVTCPRCAFKSPKFNKEKGMRVLKTSLNGMVEYVSPHTIKDIITKLYENEFALLSEMFNSGSYDQFFINILPVMPNKFRPANFVGEKVIESPINSHLARILKFSVMCENDEKFLPDLQTVTLYYFDSSKCPTSTYNGHKQILEKKEGLMRQNIMGKRVNYSARSVISPDPNLETREVGIPLVFAKNLTFPEKVTSFNFDKLRKMVINGTNVYPGANFVQSNGALINLKFISPEKRLALANQLMEGDKVVWRHLENGDPLLFNRQPTLHSTSLMGHYTRVLKNEKTIRMHYTNCKSYNADFDGDEMNVHFPQSFNPISEIHNLALNDNMYFVPSSGEPIRGLTQDHIIAASILTLKDSFFTKDEYFTIVEYAIINLNYKDKLLKSKFLTFCEPCIQSPLPLYSGKQIVTTILKNFNIFINFSVNSKMKFPGEETVLQIFKGEVISGILDKASVGASAFSLVHACGEIYGYHICNDILTVFSRMVNRYMAIKAFTVRFDDFLLEKEADQHRRDLFNQGNAQALTFQKLGCPDNFDEMKIQFTDIDISDGMHPLFKEPDFYFDNKKLALLDNKMRNFMNNYTSKADKIFQSGMFKKYPTNNMVNIVQSGSKGSMVNLGQISSALGQQELEGKRVPFMASGKTLPCFKKMEMAPAACGFIFERFLTGINPATFYFHCMAGREGLIDTAVKTANSGYLQRCLGKHLEGVNIKYDGKVMLNNRIVQFRYGDDGLNINKSSYLKNFDFYKSNITLFNHNSITKLSQKQIDLVPQAFRDLIESQPEDIKDFFLNRFLNSLANPGHPAGILAAQSIGEPSTQMTLNTFHLAGVGGKNVTLGIPRLREIIMVASKVIKTPVISIPIFKPEEANSIINIFKKVTLEDCLQCVTVDETVVVKDMEYKKHIKLTFELKDCIEEAAKSIDITFLKLLGKELKKRSSTTGITEYTERQTASTAPVESENENVKELDDNESSESSTHTEVGVDIAVENDQKGSEENDDENKTEEGFLEDFEEGQAQEDDSSDFNFNFTNLKKISNKEFVFDIYYPSDFNILLLPIIEGIAQKLVVKQVKGFNKATYSSNEMLLEGSNFANLVSIIDGKDLFEILDFYNSHTNDIYAIYKTFGVEAAREVIVKEITNVFDVYGININIRHLYIVADYMTRDGMYKSFSRHSFTMDDCFVQRMSFESCFTNLKNAAIFNTSQGVDTPSSCLLTGNLMKSGTGIFEILYDLAQLQE